MLTTKFHFYIIPKQREVMGRLRMLIFGNYFFVRPRVRAKGVPRKKDGVATVAGDDGTVYFGEGSRE